MTPRWWDLYPRKLKRELDDLQKAEIAYEKDQEQFDSGRLVLYVSLEVANEERKLKAVYPETYPFTRFEVFALNFDLKQHINPFQKNLCLLGRGTSNWKTSDTLAGILTEQLPKLFALDRPQGVERPEDLEEHQGEPLSAFYPYLPSPSIVFIDSVCDPKETFAKIELSFDSHLLRGGVLRGLLDEISSPSGQVIWKSQLECEAEENKLLNGVWVRLSSPIMKYTANEYYEELRGIERRVSEIRWYKLGNRRYSVIGVSYPENTNYRKEKTGWVFLLLTETGRDKFHASFVRAGRAGEKDIGERTPELSHLGNKKIALIGLGAIGSFSAIELARCGIGEIFLIDHDFVEPGTTVRWPLGLPVAGHQKTSVIEKFISEHYPYVKVASRDIRLGAARLPPDTVSDYDVLDEVLAGADLLFDATAEIGLQNLLSHIARKKDIPYLCASATEGAWGGIISAFQPGLEDPCWHCLQHALDDESIGLPPLDEGSNVQPTGCAEPTFTGAGFDVQEISLAAVRLAVSTLSSDESSYPRPAWNVAVISIRDEAGNLIGTSTETHILKRHPKCPNHQK